MRAVSLSATLIGFGALWLVLDRSSAALGSLRGEYGLFVCAAVLVAALIVECAVSRQTPRHVVAALGLRLPRRRAFVWTVVLCATLIAFFPLFEVASGTQLSWRADAALLAVGMFAQGGVAEEVVFRGFLFRCFRERWSFWRAALIATLPFAAVHLPLLATLDLPVALAAIGLSLSLSFPLASLYERGGCSIWLPALVHAVVQGAIKLVDGEVDGSLALGWIALSAVAPWALFALRDERRSLASPREPDSAARRFQPQSSSPAPQYPGNPAAAKCLLSSSPLDALQEARHVAPDCCFARLPFVRTALRLALR